MWYTFRMWFRRVFHKEERGFFRHPIHMPIRVMTEALGNDSASDSTTSDISLGGLKFLWHDKLQVGSTVKIDIPVREKHFEVNAKIAYCHEDRKSPGFQTGVSFTDFASAFKAKLAEEILEILEYRRRASNELGYELSEEEAAEKWVKDFAEKFSKTKKTS